MHCWFCSFCFRIALFTVSNTCWTCCRSFSTDCWTVDATSSTRVETFSRRDAISASCAERSEAQILMKQEQKRVKIIEWVSLVQFSLVVDDVTIMSVAQFRGIHREYARHLVIYFRPQPGNVLGQY